MRLLIAPDKFKDCLSAPQVADALAAGARAAGITSIDLCPMADGGEGTVAAMVAATGGSIHHATVTGPLPSMRVSAPFGLLGDAQTAVIEMSAASGLHLLSPELRNPLHTTSYGTGQLIAAALAAGASRIILGIGGSATVDGGLGCLQALGARIWVRADPARSQWNTEEALPVELTTPATGADLLAFHSLLKPIFTAPLTVACDVSNPLHGPDGAAPVFGPQKGATPEMATALDQALCLLSQRTRTAHAAATPGAGAAGGLGFALTAFLGATLRPGIELVLEATNFPARIAAADLCLTGEGKFDGSSLGGKTPIGVARACRAAGKPCVVIAGSLAPGAFERAQDQGITAAFSICDGPMDLPAALANAPALLQLAAHSALRLFLSNRP